MIRKEKRNVPLYLAAMGICAAVLSGCGNDVQTEEELVIPRTEGTEGQAGMEDGSMNLFEEGQSGQAKGAADSVAAQVQAPERYQMEFQDGNIVLRVNAEFEIPDVPGIRTKKVTARFFTQEDYDIVNTVLLDGGKLWDRDYEAMAETQGFTVEELKKRIEMLEAEMANGVDGDASYDDTDRTLNQQLAEARAMLEAAEANGIAEAAVIKELPAVVEEGGTSGADWNQLDGFVTARGRDYSIYMLNHMDKTWRWTRFYVADYNYLYYGDYFTSEDEMKEVEERIEDAQIRPEEASAKAEEALAQMGIENFAVQGGEYVANYKLVGPEKEGRTEVDRIAYGVHAIRIVDGVPVSYTRQNANSMSGDETVSWPFEEMLFVYDEDGLVSFDWSAPYEIEDLSSDYVFLLPFSEIQNIFEQMIIKKEKDRFIEEGSSLEINIDRVCLSYMRVREKNAAEGTLIPVWDFFGTETYRGSGGEDFYIRKGEYESILTINAMDGTVIDRMYGY